MVLTFALTWKKMTKLDTRFQEKNRMETIGESGLALEVPTGGRNNPALATPMARIPSRTASHPIQRTREEERTSPPSKKAATASVTTELLSKPPSACFHSL